MAEGLKALGHECVVASDGDHWKDYPRDIDLKREFGLKASVSFACRLAKALPKMRGYDIVQMINPVFLELKAERITPFYNYLRKHNKRIVMGAFGMDYYWVNTCITDKPLRYSDFNIGEAIRTDNAAIIERADWIGTAKERLNKLIANDCDGIITGLYEYHICYKPNFPDRTRFIPFPIKMPGMTEKPSTRKPINFFIGISKNRSVYKGTDIMLRAVEDICQKYPDSTRLLKAEGLPFAKYQEMMENSDVILDQLYSYTPAMNALLAMSKGIVVVGGGEPENYEIINENELRPIINVLPTYESVYNELEQLVLHPERIYDLKQQGIEYVKRHHDYVKVAQQYVDFYKSK